MEFTVSRADLVRELNLSQGVVEKKTTIPILSNVLVEADGARIILTATDLELGIRCSCPARVKKAGGGTIPARRLLDYVRLLPDGDVQVKIQENHWASLVCGRSKTRIAGMSRESFPELPKMPALLAEIPIGVLACDDRQDDICDFERGIALHAERRAAGAEEGRPGDGRHRRASSGDGGKLGGTSWHHGSVSRAACRGRRCWSFRSWPAMPMPMRSCNSPAMRIISSSSSASDCC